MKVSVPRFLILLVITTWCGKIYSQDSILNSISPHFLTKISARTNQLQQRLDKKSIKAIQKLQKEEQRLRRKLEKKDTAAAHWIFTDVSGQYNILFLQEAKTKKPKEYLPYLDTLKTGLSFLEKNPSFLQGSKDVSANLKRSLDRINDLENRLQQAENIKKFLKHRKEFLKEQLGKLGLAKELKRINKQVYYYSQQIQEYKEALKNPAKMERKAIEVLSKSKLFRDFMRKNSMLASLFRLGGDGNNPLEQASLDGLQTRVQVSNLIQQQIGAGGPGAQAQFQRNMQEARDQISQLKNKLNQVGNSTEDILPEGFKSNTQKTKSFFQRLEYGTNIQTQKATNFFPVTSDIGLSVGYRFNDRSIIGIGASYKMGWGRGWNNIRFTNQGLGLRSFIDLKLKGSFWLSSGYEQNYRTAFHDFSLLRNRNSWQSSGLIGLSKIISLKTKIFKKTRLQLLWDFLSYRQVPKTQPVVFRIGYNF